MTDNVNYLKLVKRAKLGHQESITELTQLAEGGLCAYVYRLTLNYDLSQDLVQDTLLEMIKSLKNLEFEHAHQFWAWLYRTALGKVQLHFRAQQHKKTVQMSMLDNEHLSQHVSPDYNDGLNGMIRKELSEAIFKAMGKLNLRHRSVLVLRCFEQKPYSEIATIMDCSEMAAQVLFFRAKRSLKRQLSKQGFGKGLLLIALGLFARMTTPAKAASTGSVTAASVKVGLTTTFIGAVSTKLGIAVGTAITVTAITLGGMATLNDKTTNIPNRPSKNNLISNKGEFKYPYQLVDAYDPDGDGWLGVQRYGLDPVRISPEQWLVGPPRSNQSVVILPVDHWVELKFRGKIIDGPGDDILIIERDANGEQALVFITDGAGNEYLLGTAMAGTSGQPSRTEIGFDISGVSLPFVPCAVRIICIKEGGETRGFDLHSVSTRIHFNQGDN